MEILRQIQLDSKDIRIIGNLCRGQMVKVRTESLGTSGMEFVLSSLLCNLYLDKIFKEASEHTEYGVKVNGVLLNTIRYADDTWIICNSMEGLDIALSYTFILK